MQNKTHDLEFHDDDSQHIWRVEHGKDFTDYQRF